MRFRRFGRRKAPRRRARPRFRAARDAARPWLRVDRGRIRSRSRPSRCRRPGDRLRGDLESNGRSRRGARHPDDNLGRASGTRPRASTAPTNSIRELRLIKGGGGALLREKIVAAASARMVVIADAGKEVARLGRFPLPVEVEPFGLDSTRRHVRDAAEAHGPAARDPSCGERAAGHAFVTDGGHYILDCAFGSIPDPESAGPCARTHPGRGRARALHRACLDNHRGRRRGKCAILGQRLGLIRCPRRTFVHHRFSFRCHCRAAGACAAPPLRPSPSRPRPARRSAGPSRTEPPAPQQMSLARDVVRYSGIVAIVSRSWCRKSSTRSARC